MRDHVGYIDDMVTAQVETSARRRKCPDRALAVVSGMGIVPVRLHLREIRAFGWVYLFPAMCAVVTCVDARRHLFSNRAYFRP